MNLKVELTVVSFDLRVAPVDALRGLASALRMVLTVTEGGEVKCNFFSLQLCNFSVCYDLDSHVLCMNVRTTLTSSLRGIFEKFKTVDKFINSEFLTTHCYFTSYKRQ